MRKRMFMPCLAVIFLTGCGTFLPIVKINDLPAEKRSKIQDVKIFRAEQLSGVKYQILNDVKGHSCKGKVFGSSANEPDAIDQARYFAVALGADGITDIRCVREGVSLITNCWESITCTAVAIKVSHSPIVNQPLQNTAVLIKKASLVLMPIITAGGVLHDEIAGYDAALSGSLSSQYQVLSGQKVVETVNQIYQKMSAETKAGKDCDETKCIQNVAIAFQSELVAVANITKKEGGYFLSLKILNVIEDKVVLSKSVPCKGCDSFKVMEVLQTIAGSSAGSGLGVSVE